MKTSLLKSVIIVVVMSLFVAPVVANKIGSSCDNPIQLTKGLQMTISEPGSYWFSSWTYDLPLTVYYIPDVFDNNQRPIVYVDFSCTTGVYDDPNLEELTNLATGWGIEMPIPFTPRETIVDGERAYVLSVQESHRDMMREFGILYDVEAKVEVIVPASGKIQLVPDTAFRTCVESSTWLSLSDTIGVTPVDWDKSYVFPLSDWKNDSIRFTWMGEEQSMTIWLGTDCSFELDETNENVVKKYELNPIEGQNTLDFSSADLMDLYQFGSLLYIKFVSTESASLIIDYKPMSAEMARAIPMLLDEPVEVKNDLNQYYYFKTELKANALQFNADIKDTIVAYFGITPTFELNTLDHIATYMLCPTKIGSQLALSKKQLAAFTNGVESEYLFVRFDAPSSTNMTLSIWDASVCLNNSIELLPNGTIEIPAVSSSTIYRVNYEQWSKGDVELSWSGISVLPIYLADTCSFNLNASDPHVVYTTSIPKKSSVSIAQSVFADAVDRVDEDGYLYFRFNARAKGTLITKLTPITPPEPTSPCVANSIELKANDQLVLNLDSAFTVYRINYNEWVATGATLTWKGVEPLHTFVAETCEFAVAPYNKYVHAYVTVPAEGVAVIDAAKLAEMASYVDEDGYLYIRFLTEKEGVLEVK